ncbi:MAG: hypothetical protein JW779_13965 [Candidatus Thorarchaeota archaeon]|nr:hypothetical protein [Candidatus Thorarchaeota archaeon]
MEELNIESINLTRFDLKGTSRLIVLLGSSEGIKGASRRLKQYDDFVRVGRGLFIAHNLSSEYSDILQSLPTLSFLRTREIPGINERFNDPYANRVYSIVSYTFRNPTAGQKKKVERLIRKSAGIRLRPGVIIFPVLRAKEHRKLFDQDNGPSLLDSKDFNHELKSLGAVSIRWSRLRLTSVSDSGQIEAAIERTLVRDLHSVETKLQDIRESIKASLTSTDNLRKQLSIVSRRYRELKFKWTIAKAIWHYDSIKPLKRVYNLGLSTRNMIDNRAADSS